MTELIPSNAPAMERLIDMALATCASPHTRRMYRSQLRKFLSTGLPLTREGVALHLQRERDAGKGGSTLLSANAAIRKLATEAEVRGLISPQELAQIQSVSTGRIYKPNTGIWLTVAQVQAFLALPDRRSWVGKRDACILSMMLGLGLRRAEMADITWDSYHERDGRKCIHVYGKGGKYRTLPVPAWTQSDMDTWYHAQLSTLPPVPSVSVANLAPSKRGHQPNQIAGGMGPHGVYGLVCEYGQRIGVDLAPHDLRRTLAQMLRKSGAALEQIQYTLGHESIETTMLYLGGKLELAPGLAAVDALRIDYHALLMGLEDERAAIGAEEDLLEMSPQ